MFLVTIEIRDGKGRKCAEEKYVVLASSADAAIRKASARCTVLTDEKIARTFAEGPIVEAMRVS